MAAFVEHSFERSFLLDEQRLRKIKDIISSRLSNHSPNLKLEYTVYRGDSYSYKTDSIDAVAEEDNEDWKRITRLILSMIGDENFKFSLVFSAKGIELNIEGKDRDEVFLLLSDLRDFIGNEVAIGRVLSSKVEGIFVVVSFFGLLVVFMFLSFFISSFDPQNNASRVVLSFEPVLQSSDIQAKLNFLIRSLEPPPVTFIPYSFIVFTLFAASMCIYVLIVIYGGFQKLVKLLFPANVFLFGKLKQSFEHRQRIVSNVIWTVIIGLIVSTIGGIITWYITTPHG